MPTVNFFSTSSAQKELILKQLSQFKVNLVASLSCSDIKLDEKEISIRIIQSDKSGMIANLEVEITAHAFEERIQKQDEICLEFRECVMELIPGVDVRVWLLLPQLGHSWE